MPKSAEIKDISDIANIFGSKNRHDTNTGKVDIETPPDRVYNVLKLQNVYKTDHISLTILMLLPMMTTPRTTPPNNPI